MNRRKFLGFLAGAAVTAGAGTGGVLAFLHQEQFGALPEGEDMRRILLSPHYADGEFRNLIPRPVLSDGSSFAGALLRSFVTKKTDPVPPYPVPSCRPDFHSLPRDEDAVIWFGHSSFFLQTGGKRILIDPVFSDHAAPVSFSVRAFAGTNPVTARDIPPIDCLLISHDHWDHLDYPTVMALKEKTKMVVCGLGTGAHFRRWGFPRALVHEADWGDAVDLGGNVAVRLVTASHYSGRSLTGNRTLWTGFMLESAQRRVFFSGDSGYGPHFADTRRRFGAPDLALLDCGQYDERWKYIHMTPEEAVQAAQDLGAKVLMPAHAGKFSLAYHSWDDPFRRVTAASSGKNFTLATPVIGEVVLPGRPLPVFPRWWEKPA